MRPGWHGVKRPSPRPLPCRKHGGCRYATRRRVSSITARGATHWRRSPAARGTGLALSGPDYGASRHVEQTTTMPTRPVEKVLAAPDQLTLESRTAFRRAAAEHLSDLPEGNGRLVLDLTGTRHVDSAGLGALMLVQR